VVPRGERSSNTPDLLDNLQVWAENNYDTRILHSNLAFPLLKALANAGDPVAKRVFKSEVATRFSSNFEPVKMYLLAEGYLKSFTEEELEVIGATRYEAFMNYNYKGSEALEKNKIDDAILNYNKALEIVPDSNEVLNGLGRALKRKGRLKEALEAYLKGLETDRFDHYIISNISEVYDIMGDYKKSMEYAQKAIELFPGTYEAYFYQGNVYMSRGQYNMAIESYVKALISPIRWHFVFEEKRIYDKLIECYLILGQTEEAEATKIKYKKSLLERSF